MKSTFFGGLLAAILLGLLCATVWGLGPMHTDDATWALRAWDTPGPWLTRDPIGPWAVQQGRIWAYVSGSFILYTLHWQGAAWGELLRLGSFAAFFASFAWAVRAYCGTRVALLACAFAAGWFMVRWDGSILVTYPLITWVAAIAFCLALLAGRAYVRGGDGGWCALAFLLAFFSFMNNEGVTALFMLLSVLAARSLRREGDARRARTLLVAWLLACGAYAALYVGWRITHPSSYDGNSLASFSPVAFVRALVYFSTSGNALYDLLASYRVTYADAQDSTGVQNIYRITTTLREGGLGLQALAVGAVMALLVWGALSRTGEQRARAPVDGTRRAMVAGVLVALVVIVPVAMTGKYQGWVMHQGIRAYSHTALAHFGWSLALAGLLARWFDSPRRPRRRTATAAAIAVLCGLLAAGAAQTNRRIVDDMRTEAGRWRMLDDLLQINRSGAHAPALVIPRLANGSWYTVVDPAYWGAYAKARHGDSTPVITRPASAPADSLRDAAVADYAFDVRRQLFVGLLASSAQPRAWVFVDGGDAGALTLVAASADGASRRLAPKPAGRMGEMEVYEFETPPSTATLRVEGAALDSQRRVLGVDLSARRVLK